MKILAHAPFIGITGYANHARSFLTALNKYHTVKVRNFTIGDTWNGMSNTPHNNESYITDEMKDMLILQTLFTADKSRIDEPMYGYKGDFKPDINIILQETGHYYFYDNYDEYTIAYNVYESTRYPDDFFKRLITFDEIWVPTQWQHNSIIEQGANPNKIKIVPEGVDIDTFKPIKNTSKKDKFRFLMFGRWDYRKSTTEILQTFNDTFKDTPNVELIASVENPYPSDETRSTEDRIKKYNINTDKIEFIKFTPRDDYIKYLQEGDVFLSCARSEGWNLPLIEAMSCGIPALYSNWGGQLQFAKNKGVPVDISHIRPANIGDKEVGGEYCEPDFNDLSKKLVDVYENYDKHRKKSLKDAKIIHKDFNWDNVAQIACDILKDKEKYTSDLWYNYYNNFNVPSEKSTFAEFCLPYMGEKNRVLDICCGNGRDSKYFKDNNITTYGFDLQQSGDFSGVKFKKLNLEDKKDNFTYPDKFFNHIYSRFVLHVVPEILEDYILINSNKALEKNGLLFIETRSDKGKIGKSSPAHYRRLINIDKLKEKLRNLNFEIEYEEESNGLSIYKDDDPILIRIIARKKGEIKTVTDNDWTSAHINLNDSKELLLKTKYVLDNNNISFLLLFGTLLGAYRDKNFIAHDTDIDIGIFQKDRNKIRKLIDDGYFAIYGIKFLRDIEDTFFQIQYKKDYLDFYCLEKNSNVYEIKLPNHYYTIPSEQIDNGFSDIDFIGETFSTVNNIERYLTRIYDDWRTPQKGFHAKSETKDGYKIPPIKGIHIINPIPKGSEWPSDSDQNPFLFVTTGNLGYMPTIEKLVKSINEFSKNKIIVYGVDCDVPFDYPNVIKRRINPPKHSEHDKWYWKQYACIEALNEGYNNFVWMDGDVVVNHNIDSISKYFPMLENYPIPDIHIQDEFFTRYNDNGTQKTQYFNEELANLWGLERTTPYMHICMYIYDKNSKWWFEEIIKSYNEIDLKDYGKYYHWNDEGIDNALRWKYGFKKHLPLSNFDTSSYDGDAGFTNLTLKHFYKFWNEEGPQNFNRIFGYQRIPKDKSDIIYFHGNKDGEVSDKMIEFIKMQRDDSFYESMYFYIEPYVLVNMGEIFDIEGSTLDIAHKFSWHHAVFHEIYNLKDYYNNREKKINDGDIVVDVGANMGVFNRWAYTQGASKVISFEPDKRYYELLKLNADPRSILFNAAIADKMGTIELRESNHFGGSNVFWTPENTNGYTVETYTLDYLFESKLVDHIDFLKVDIEGAEQIAFKGISDENLKKINNISMEYHHSHLKYDEEIRHNLIKRLNANGFNSYILFLGTNNALQMIYFTR